MIPSDTFQSYAQFNEDVILATLFNDKPKGFYVDVGASHEEHQSVTKYFYERGWRGINIEPIPRLAKELQKTRKRDINLDVAVSTKKGELLFREYPQHDGLSTLSEKTMAENDKADLPHVDYTVKTDTLANIFKTHNVDAIDFLKIDVEGFEEDVLKSNNWKQYRPQVICIEANHRDTDWTDYLLGQKYHKFIFDGLNEYYIANEAKDLTTGYAERAAIKAYNALQHHHFKQWRDDLAHTSELRAMTERQDQLIKDLQKELAIKDKKVEDFSFLVRRLLRLLAGKGARD